MAIVQSLVVAVCYANVVLCSLAFMHEDLRIHKQVYRIHHI